MSKLGFAEDLIDSCDLPYSLVTSEVDEYRANFNHERLVTCPNNIQQSSGSEQSLWSAQGNP